MADHKLFYFPGACSLSCHIALEEAGIPYDMVNVQAKNLPEADATEFHKLSPFGFVPILKLPKGEALTQNVAILTYLADQAPKAGLLPEAGTVERAHALEWLSFVTSDVHKGYGVLFAAEEMVSKPEAQAEVEAWGKKSLNEYLEYADKWLSKHDFVLGSKPCAADYYLFVVYGWSKWVEVSTDAYKSLNAHTARVFERPAVQRAMKAEGLIKS